LAISLFVATEAGAQTERSIAFLERRTSADADDFVAWNQLADRYLQQLRETGNDEWLRKARRATEASLRAIPAESNAAGLALSARVDLAEHRFAEARRKVDDLARLEPNKTGTLSLRADVLLESGDFEDAEKTIARLEECGVGELMVASRRGRLCLLRGERDAAREHYEKARAAAGEGSAPFWIAWTEVQLGELAFSSGDWERAEQHYTAALAKQPAWWTAQEHLAELRATQGKEEEAFSLYTKIVERIPRPELLQAIGDLHLFNKRNEEAKKWHEGALAGYQRGLEEGSPAYYHHLASFFCDSQPNGELAVKWARKDLETRDTPAARDALAWALYKAGRIEDAATEIKKALGRNPTDPHILQHAAMIQMSAGDIGGGQAALRTAAAINPRFQSFHVHR